MEVTRENMKCENIKGGITFQKIDKIILLPIKHAKSTHGPGNKVLLGFIQLFNHWLSVPEDKLAIIRDIIIDFYTYTIIDDILDYTTLRQGIPTAHKIFGITNTIIAFDFNLCSTLGKVLELNHPEAMALYLDAFRETLAGQGIEIYWRENAMCPTEEEYNQMTIRKIGACILLLKRLMQLFNSTHRDTERFITTVSLYGQITNDYNCLTNPKYFASKGFCDDITEGKFSFPILHAINSHPEEKQTIIHILQQHTKDIHLKKECLSILKKCGSFEYTLDKLKTLKLIILQEMNNLGKNPHMSDCLEYLQETN